MSILSFASLIKSVADRYGYDAALLAAQAQQESAGNPAAKSPVGAMGLMQFMPGTWGDYGRGADPFDPEASLDAGVRYMKDLLARFQKMGAASPVELALASYNAGPGTVDKAIQASGRSDWDGVRPYLKDRNGNPLTETQNYVPAIMRFLTLYRATFGVAKVAIPGLAIGLIALFGVFLLRRIL